jgi:hypothetical protein
MLMAKVLKILGRIFGIAVEWILLSVMLLAFIVRFPSVQSFFARQATSYLSSELHTTVKLDQLEIVFLNKIALKGLMIKDLKNDTLVSMDELLVTIDQLKIAKNEFVLGQLALKKGKINIQRDKKTGAYNYAFLEDYFASSDKSTSKSKPIKLDLKRVSLRDFHIKYDDNRKYTMPYGVDYDHLALKNVYLLATNFKVRGNDLAFQLDQLKFKERAGININQLSAHVSILEKGLHLRNFKIQTAKTSIHFPKFNFDFKDWDAFNSFDDEVYFDAYLAPSLINLADISYFAPELKGMSDRVALSGQVSERLRNLTLTDLHLRFGKSSYLKGNLVLPDFRLGDRGKLNEYIRTAHISVQDLARLKMPEGVSSIDLGSTVDLLDFANIRDLQINGDLTQIQVKLKEAQTAIGTVGLKSPMRIAFKPDGVALSPVQVDSTFIQIQSLDIAKLSGVSDFGIANGFLRFDGFFANDGAYQLNKMSADLSRLDYLGYSYSNIHLTDGQIVDEQLSSTLKIKDPNLELDYTGKISLNEIPSYQVNLDIKSSDLTRLHFTNSDETHFVAKLNTTITGKSLKELSGSINTNYLNYQEAGKTVAMDYVRIDFDRQINSDFINIESSLLNARVQGKIDYNTVVGDFLQNLSQVFPSMAVTRNLRETENSHTNFTYQFEVNQANDLLAIFVPGLKIANGTSLRGSFKSKEDELVAKLLSSEIQFEEVRMQNVNMNQTITNSGINGDLFISTLNYGDSLTFSGLEFLNEGKDGVLSSSLMWDKESNDFSSIKWTTTILGDDQVNFVLEPSFFSINGYKWEIENQSDITLANNDLSINEFRLSRGSQLIKMEGCLTKNDRDKLHFQVSQVKLDELSRMFGMEQQFAGSFSGWGDVSNPYTNFNFSCDARVENFFIDGEEVGTVSVLTDWNEKRESIFMQGELKYRGMRTFDFNGLYAVKKNELDLKLQFDQTDIKFVNAFMDPEVVKDIQGKVNGSIQVKGSPDKPELSGKLRLLNGGAEVELLGVKYRTDGIIDVKEESFEITNIPLYDEVGNVAYIIGTINHNNFTDWNFDLQFNMEDDIRKINPLTKRNAAIEQFMVLNTKYKEGDIYYGKAFARGMVNISGTDSDLEVFVDLETKKNTDIVFPMYGVSEIEQEEDFIHFINKSELQQQLERKLDFSGIDLDLNFKITQDAQMKLIFNEQIGDEIIARGDGKMNIKLDQLDQLTMIGKYSIATGSKYNFAMGSIKQLFMIESGSVIEWTGDPYDALIDVNTVATKKASILELSPELADKSLVNQDVYCYLKLTDKLLSPQIAFDIKAPRAPETGRALIDRVLADPDEKNRQFFSLLLVSKFQPLKGNISAGGSAALDLIESQINAALSNLSENYKLNLDVGSDASQGETSVAIGMKKGILDDRLVISGSFGVENRSSTSDISGTKSVQNSVIGDVSLEYKIKENFRVRAFNQSNNATVKQNAGPFTQGIGISYREEFNHWNDLQFIQKTLRLLNSKESDKMPIDKRKRQAVTIPNSEITVPESVEKINTKI